MNFLLRWYYLLPSDTQFGFVGKVLNRISARVTKRILDFIVPQYFLVTQRFHPSGITSEPREKELVVSLTSFPARIQEVWIAVECLLRQSNKPSRIVLWLSEDQFKGKEIPQKLLNQTTRGLEIVFVKGDLRSHKKYFYAFDDNPDAILITVDDDLYYDHKLLKNLLKIHSEYPKAIATNRAHQMVFDRNGTVQAYRNWKHNVANTTPSIFNVQTGGYGTLYHSEDLYSDHKDHALLSKLAPHADDLWLKVQTLLKKKEVVTNNRYNKDPITIGKSQLEKLVNLNVMNDGNDVQLNNLLDHYGLNTENAIKNYLIK